MAITINGSGTITGVSAGGLPDGSITADDLASTLDLGSKTVTLPSGTGGKVLQYITSISNNNSVSTTSTTFIDEGTSISITPSSTSNKILLFVSANGNQITVSDGLRVRLYNDTQSYALITAGNSYGNILYNNSASNLHAPIAIINFDTPASTSAQTYKLQIASNSGGQMRVARDWQETILIAMEIAG